jgi:hypothetical protein
MSVGNIRRWRYGLGGVKTEYAAIETPRGIMPCPLTGVGPVHS